MASPQKINLLSVPFTALVDVIGRKSIDTVRYLLQLFIFSIRSLGAWRATGKVSHINRRSIVSQIIFSGIDALPVITIISLALALSVTAQFILLLQAFTTEKEVIRVITQIVAQEFAPLLSAIILIGRSGSAITVDLGNMRLHDEIQGLELLGIDIREFFVLPRMLGLAFSQFALAVYFSGIVMVFGVIFSALLDSPSNYKYLLLLLDAFTPSELLVFLLKNLLFGLIMGAVACFHGLRVEKSITELPQQTQQAIVNSLVLIFVFDGLFVIAL
jgi:phospholipid/cholesterol/gamma-HCH transport system permease protein